MTNKPSKPINLFDCATSQKVIGQENFLNAFKTILNHGGYAQGPETCELDQKLADYSGTKFCATCGSGTDALTLALMAWDVKPAMPFLFLPLLLLLPPKLRFCSAQPRFSLIQTRTLII